MMRRNVSLRCYRLTAAAAFLYSILNNVLSDRCLLQLTPVWPEMSTPRKSEGPTLTAHKWEQMRGYVPLNSKSASYIILRVPIQLHRGRVVR